MYIDVAGHTTTELYQHAGPSLVSLGTAAAKLQIPINAAAASRAVEKVREQSAALDRQRAERAERVTGRSQASTPTPRSAAYTPTPAPVAAVQALAMTRTQSGPAATTLPSALTPSNAVTERIPLKTKVVQFVALGPTTMEEIVAKTNGEPADVERIAKVVSGPHGHDMADVQRSQPSPMASGR